MKKIFLPLFFLLLAGGVIVSLIVTQKEKKPERILPALGEVPEFSFLNQDSLPFTKQHLAGNVTIADFIFTSCGGPCPLMTSKMSELQTKFAGQRKIQLLSFSVDPEYDTPSILTEYANKFNAKREQWTFLTGDKHKIYEIARYGFHLTTEDEGEAILHSTKFILIDKKGTIRGYYDYDDSTAIPQLIEDAQLVADEA